MKDRRRNKTSSSKNKIYLRTYIQVYRTHGYTCYKFPLHGEGLPPVNPCHIPARRQQRNAYITRTEHVHPSVFMLCRYYVHAMFMIIGKDSPTITEGSTIPEQKIFNFCHPFEEACCVIVKIVKNGL